MIEKINNIKIDNLKEDDKNFNKGTSRGEKILRHSLERLGVGRSIVVDKDNNIIAGNKTANAAKYLGVNDVIVVETDGTKLVAVKRTDLSLEDEKGRELALADNIAAKENIDIDYILLRDTLDKEILKGYEIKDRIQSNTEMLSKVEFNSCYYEPKEKPSLKLHECLNLEKFRAKVEAINEFELPEETKEVLKWFAYRFIKIDFESVANYYEYNASEEERKAIERLRLVLVDNGEKGYIEDDMLRILNAAEMSEREV